MKIVNIIISRSVSKVRIRRGKISPDLEELFLKKESLKANIHSSVSSTKTFLYHIREPAEV